MISELSQRPSPFPGHRVPDLVSDWCCQAPRYCQLLGFDEGVPDIRALGSVEHSADEANSYLLSIALFEERFPLPPTQRTA